MWSGESVSSMPLTASSTLAGMGSDIRIRVDIAATSAGSAQGMPLCSTMKVLAAGEGSYAATPWPASVSMASMQRPIDPTPISPIVSFLSNSADEVMYSSPGQFLTKASINMKIAFDN